MNNLTKFYQAVLETSGLHLVDDVVHATTSDGDTPVTVSGKILVLPTDRWLKEPDWKNIQAFHPLAENVLRKESLIFKFLRRAILIQTTTQFVNTVRTLLHFAVQKDQNAVDPIRHLPFLSCVPDADEKLIEVFDKIHGKIDPNGETALMNLVMLRGKKIKDKSYTRVSKVMFPLFDELKDADTTVYGVKMRKRDVVALRNIFNYVFEGYEQDEDTYSNGSNSQVAPSLHALLGSYYKLISALNRCLSNFDQPTIPLTWFDELSDFASFKGLIPALDGNAGEAVDGEEEPAPAPSSRPSVRETPRETQPEPRRAMVQVESRVSQPQPVNGIKRASMGDYTPPPQTSMSGRPTSRYDRTYEENSRLRAPHGQNNRQAHRGFGYSNVRGRGSMFG